MNVAGGRRREEEEEEEAEPHHGLREQQREAVPRDKGGGVNGEKDGRGIHGLNTDAKDGGAGLMRAETMPPGKWAGTGTADGSAHGGRRSHRRQLSDLCLEGRGYWSEEGDELDKRLSCSCGRVTTMISLISLRMNFL